MERLGTHSGCLPLGTHLPPDQHVPSVSQFSRRVEDREHEEHMKGAGGRSHRD